jgi:hypothetical protein
MILRSDGIELHNSKPLSRFDNCFKGTVTEIIPSEYGMEIMVDAGEIFYVDISINDFKILQLSESSEVWITFPPESGIALPGTV